MSNVLLCWNCGTALGSIPLPISRHTNCPQCFEVLHCCRLCHHYALAKPGECAHERADPPVIKESANFCEFFKPSFSAYNPNTAKANQAAGSEFDALFDDKDEDAHSVKPGETGTIPTYKKAQNPLDDLFKN